MMRIINLCFKNSYANISEKSKKSSEIINIVKDLTYLLELKFCKAYKFLT